MLPSLTASAASLFGSLVYLGLEIALLVVAATTVKRFRADVSWLIATAALIMIMGTLVGMMWPALAGLLINSSSGTDGHARRMAFSAVMSFTLTVLRSGGLVMLIVGVYRLAKPSPQPLEAGQVPWSGTVPGA